MPSRNVNAWMWAEACGLLDQAERLHRQYFRLGSTADAARYWEPPVDIVTLPHEVRITVALPGVAADQIQVHAADGVIIVDAVRPPPQRTAGTAIHRLEIPYGRFRRRISLPPGHYELTEQTLADGCLELRLAHR